MRSSNESRRRSSIHFWVDFVFDFLFRETAWAELTNASSASAKRNQPTPKKEAPKTHNFWEGGGGHLQHTESHNNAEVSGFFYTFAPHIHTHTI